MKLRWVVCWVQSKKQVRMFFAKRTYRTIVTAVFSLLIYSHCAFGDSTIVSFFGSAVNFVSVPTALSLSHASRSKTFTVSWTAGKGNGGVASCKIQFLNSASVWTDLLTVNCDEAGASVGTVTLPNDGWYGGNWSSVNIRLVRNSDSLVVGVLGNLTCSATAGSASSTPSIDEDCNNYWNNSAASSGCASGSACYQVATYQGYSTALDANYQTPVCWIVFGQNRICSATNPYPSPFHMPGSQGCMPYNGNEYAKGTVAPIGECSYTAYY